MIITHTYRSHPSTLDLSRLFYLVGASMVLGAILSLAYAF